MAIGWSFRERAPNEKIRNPVQGEFFSDEAIERPAQSLVREVCQNSIDARRQETVTVRFRLSGDEHALSPETAAEWFGGAWDHLRAPRSGLRDVPAAPTRCPFLVVEDFGTTGLLGDPADPDPPDEPRNLFHAFFRAEGVSIKEGSHGGRWGVGKVVFPRSGKYNLFFGLTVRNDDGRRLLMGQAVLKYHALNGKSYSPDGGYGDFSPQALVMPLSDSAIVDRFERTFGLERADRPGLSVVVPYVDEDITAASILESAMYEYFYPILAGRLIIRVEGPDLPSSGVELNAGTFRDHLHMYGGELDTSLAPVISLAMWARDLKDEQRVVLAEQPESRAPQWSPDLLAADRADELAERFRKGERIAVRAPLFVRRRGRDPELSHLDVYIQRDLDERGSVPVFLRDGIAVPGKRERQVRGHRVHVLVVAEAGALATLLGDAEPPAHTHWDHRNENFIRAGYLGGQTFLDFVRGAPHKVAELLTAKVDDRDRFSLSEFFPRPPEDDGWDGRRKRRRRKGDRSEEDGTEDIKSRPQPFVIEKLADGFVIRRASLEVPLPKQIAIRVAYEVRRGSAMSKYHPADFQLDRKPIRRSLQRAREVVREGNVLVIEPKDDRFRVEVTGFGLRRNLIVKAHPVKEAADDQAV